MTQEQHQEVFVAFHLLVDNTKILLNKKAFAKEEDYIDVVNVVLSKINSIVLKEYMNETDNTKIDNEESKQTYRYLVLSEGDKPEYDIRPSFANAIHKIVQATSQRSTQPGVLKALMRIVLTVRNQLSTFLNNDSDGLEVNGKYLNTIFEKYLKLN